MIPLPLPVPPFFRKSGGASAPFWTSLVNAEEGQGGSITKTSGGSSWDAGGVSVKSLAASGYVEFRSSDDGSNGGFSNKMLGLSNGDTDQGFADIDFAIFLTSGGAIQIYESGSLKASPAGGYLISDVFRVENSGGTILYKKNGGLLYTSLVSPTSPLRVDCSIFTTGRGLTDVLLVDL